METPTIRVPLLPRMAGYIDQVRRAEAYCPAFVAGLDDFFYH